MPGRRSATPAYATAAVSCAERLDVADERVATVVQRRHYTPMQERMRAEFSATLPRIEKFVKLHATGDLVSLA